MTVAWQCWTVPPSPVSPSLSLLLSYGGLSCQVTLNSERPPTRQNRLKVLAVRVFITRLAKPPALSAADSAAQTCMGLHVLLSSVDSSSCFSPPVTTTSAQIFQRYRATQNPSHWYLNIGACSELGVQAADCVSLFIPCSFPLSRPTSSLVHLAAHLSGTIVYFGSSAPAKNRPKRVEHIRSRGPLGDSRPVDPSAASERGLFCK